MKKVILMAAASLAIFATSFAQNAETTVPKAKTTKSKKKPAMDAPAQGTPSPAAAEKSKAPEKGHEKGHTQGQVGGVNKELGLTAEQETKFKAINEGHKTATQAVQKDASMAADAKRAQVELLKSKYESDVQGVLNTDQFAKWQEMRAKRGGPKGGPRGDGDHKEGNHKEGGHKADGATKPTPATGTTVPAAPVEGMKMKDKKGKKDQ